MYSTCLWTTINEQCPWKCNDSWVIAGSWSQSMLALDAHGPRLSQPWCQWKQLSQVEDWWRVPTWVSLVPPLWSFFLSMDWKRQKGQKRCMKARQGLSWRMEGAEVSASLHNDRHVHWFRNVLYTVLSMPNFTCVGKNNTWSSAPAAYPQFRCLAMTMYLEKDKPYRKG